MSQPLLSVVIPTYNEEKEIANCLQSIKEQSYKNTEVIIVDDGSTDSTLSVIKKFRSSKILRQQHRGPGAARNLGAKKAKGEILIFVDADMTFHKDYLKNLVKPILKDKTGKVIGTEESTQIARNLDNIWSRCQGKMMSDPKNKDRKIFRAIRRNKFLELGGFDSKYGYADDQTFWFKHKIKPVIAEKAICYHKNPETLKSVYKQSRWIGSSSMSPWLNIPIANLFGISLLVLLSPPAIIMISIRKSLKIKNFSIFPYMLVFMAFRYFGTIFGYLKKVIRNENFR